MNKQTWRLTADQKKRIAYWYRKGVPVKCIAADFHICTKAVCHIAWRRGEEHRNRRDV